MISALTVLFAAQAASPGKAPSTFDEILAEANQRWYALPSATSKFTVRSASDAGVMREARDGERMHFEIRRNDLLLFAVYRDAQIDTVLDFGTNRYSVSTEKVAPRTKQAEEEEPLPALEPGSLDFRFSTTRGLILRVDPPLPVLSDEKTVVEGVAMRKITTRLARPKRDDEHPGGTFEATILIDGAGGWLRDVQASFVELGKESEPIKFRFECDPKVAGDEAFAFDVARLKNWTKAERVGGPDGASFLGQRSR